MGLVASLLCANHCSSLAALWPGRDVSHRARLLLLEWGLPALGAQPFVDHPLGFFLLQPEVGKADMGSPRDWRVERMVYRM